VTDRRSGPRHRASRSSGRILAAAAAVALVVAVVVGVRVVGKHRTSAARPTATTTAAHTTAAGVGSSAAATSPGVSPSPTVSRPPTSTASGPQLGSHSAKLSVLEARAARVPVRIGVQAIEVSAPILGVGTDPATQELVVPPTVATAVWWAYGARPGDSSGDVVVAAHVDYNHKYGIFFDLYRLSPGTLVTVTTANGATKSYVVASNVHVVKPALAQRQLFTTTGRPRLTLITCGGSFDPAKRSYRDNIVVTATPLG